MITFVGAGPGAEDLITVRGQRLLKEADIVIYAGSLVNPGLLKLCKEKCKIYNSAKMTLEEVLEVMVKGYGDGKEIVRLHTGDPCLYGAIREQMDELKKLEIPYEDCPGVSSFCGAAAALEAEYTLPGISQSVVITRMAGRTPVPEKESVRSFAAHQATMVLFLSTGLLKELSVLFLRILSYTEQSLNLKIKESPGTLMKKRKVCVLENSINRKLLFLGVYPSLLMVGIICFITALIIQE